MKTKLSLIQISNKMKSLKNLPEWIKIGRSIFEQISILRGALGITQEQLAVRANTYQANIAKIESGEVADIQLSTLKGIANALNSELIVSLVPKEEILPMVERKAEEKAKQIIAASSANMAMELQKPDAATIREQISEMKEEIIKKRRSILWEGNES